MKKHYILFFLIFGQALTAQALTEIYSKGLKAHKHGQYEKFLYYAKQLDSLRPAHPKYRFDLACAYALNDKPADAIATLEKCILKDSKADYENETDFKSLTGLPEYEKLAELKKSLERVVKTSKKETTLSEKDLHPEGLVYLPKSKLWLAGSIRKGKIVSFHPKKGKCADWLQTDLSVFAMKPDPDEKYLWVAASAMEEMEGYTPKIKGAAKILKVNIATKAIENVFSFDGKHLYGDLIVAKDGSVYISDSASPAIYLIRNDTLYQWLSLEGKAFNLQGLAFSGDESKIYIADYLKGIMEIPVADRNNHRWLAMPEGHSECGIDGLMWHKNSLIAIHNGVKPIRIMQYHLDQSGNIDSVRVIDHNRPEFNEPALGFIVKDKCYFFANSPWNAYDKSRKNLDAALYENPMLYSFTPD